MTSLEQLADRLAIQDLLVAYSHAIDFRRWDELDDVFTEDAHIDYTAFGGPKGPFPEIKEYLRSTMETFAGYYHMVSTSKVDIDGDTATAVTICHNPMVLPLPDGGEHVFVCGLWYQDTFVRTPAGWRISSRVEEKTYVQNPPTGLG